MFTWQFGKRSGFTSTAQERGYSASAPESSATEPAQSPCAWVHFVKFLNLHMNWSPNFGSVTNLLELVSLRTLFLNEMYWLPFLLPLNEICARSRKKKLHMK